METTCSPPLLACQKDLSSSGGSLASISTHSSLCLSTLSSLFSSLSLWTRTKPSRYILLISILHNPLLTFLPKSWLIMRELSDLLVQAGCTLSQAFSNSYIIRLLTSYCSRSFALSTSFDIIIVQKAVYNWIVFSSFKYIYN